MQEAKKNEKRPYFEKMRQKYRKEGEPIPVPPPRDVEDFIKNIPFRSSHGNIVDVNSRRDLKKDEERAGIDRKVKGPEEY